MSEIYWNGEYKKKHEVGIPPDDRGFLFGDGVYEVVRIYRGRCFEMSAHEHRLLQSASGIGINIGYFKGMLEVAENLLRRNILVLLVTASSIACQSKTQRPSSRM